MDNAIIMTRPHDLGDGPDDGGGPALGVMASGDDPVKELPALAELHDEVDGGGVLVRLPEPDDVGVLRERRHDRDLSANVVDVDGGAELRFGDGFAGQGFAGVVVGAEVGDAELAAAELVAEGVLVEESGAAEGDEVFQDGDGGGGEGGVGIGVGTGFSSPTTAAVSGEGRAAAGVSHALVLFFSGDFVVFFLR